MENGKELPRGWSETTLGKVAFYLNGRAFKPNEWEENGLPIIRIQNLNNPKAKFNFSTKEYEDRYKVVNGELLFAWSASLGTYIWNSGNAWLNQHIFKVIPQKCIEKKYLFYMLDELVHRLYSETHGSGMVHITKGKFESKAIPLPPLQEQHRIVAKIEELFSELDKGVESLKTAQQQLKIYRQAVLKRAFEGKLTEKWRTKQKNISTVKELLERIRNEKSKDVISKGKKIKKVDSIKEDEMMQLEELPCGWIWTRIGEVSTCLDSMRIPVNKEERKKRTGNIPYYGANGLVGYIDNYIFDEELILVVEDETFIGREKPFSYMIKSKSWVNNHAHVLRSKINPEYLNYQLAFYPFTPLTTGTTGRKKLTQEALINAPIRLCTLEEQAQIVQEIESRLSVCNKMEEVIEQSLIKAEALRQSILKKAFEGNLVPQDPDDEPAEKLLERIRAEKETHKPEGSITKRRTKR